MYPEIRDDFDLPAISDEVNHLRANYKGTSYVGDDVCMVFAHTHNQPVELC